MFQLTQALPSNGHSLYYSCMEVSYKRAYSTLCTYKTAAPHTSALQRWNLGKLVRWTCTRTLRVPKRRFECVSLGSCEKFCSAVSPKHFLHVRQQKQWDQLGHHYATLLYKESDPETAASSVESARIKCGSPLRFITPPETGSSAQDDSILSKSGSSAALKWYLRHMPFPSFLDTIREGGGGRKVDVFAWLDRPLQQREELYCKSSW